MQFLSRFSPYIYNKILALFSHSEFFFLFLIINNVQQFFFVSFLFWFSCAPFCDIIIVFFSFSTSFSIFGFGNRFFAYFLFDCFFMHIHLFIGISRFVGCMSSDSTLIAFNNS